MQDDVDCYVLYEPTAILTPLRVPVEYNITIPLCVYLYGTVTSSSEIGESSSSKEGHRKTSTGYIDIKVSGGLVLCFFSVPPFEVIINPVLLNNYATLAPQYQNFRVLNFQTPFHKKGRPCTPKESLLNSAR